MVAALGALPQAALVCDEMGHLIRAVVTSPEIHLQGVVSHVKGLQAAGKRVLFLAADRPYAALVDILDAEGVDTSAMFFVDAVTCMDGKLPAQRPDNALFLQSPTMLEMMAMRIEQMISRLGGKAHVVIDSLSTLALYNGIPPVQEFSHYLANRLRTNQVPGDFVIRDNQAGRELHERIMGFTDDQLRLEVSQ